MTDARFSAQVVARRPEGPRGQVLTLAVPAALAAAHRHAGQYCAVGVSGAEEGIFALTSPPGAPNFELYIQPAGGSSDRLVACALGATVSVSAPAGAGYGVEAALDAGGPLYALGAGSGLSGLLAAARVIHARGRTFRLYAGFRTVDDVLFAADLAAFAARGSQVRVILTRPPAGPGRRVQHALAADAADLRDAWVLACGPAAMQADARATCLALGLPPEHFLTNY